MAASKYDFGYVTFVPVHWDKQRFFFFQISLVSTILLTICLRVFLDKNYGEKLMSIMINWASESLPTDFK